MTYEQARDSCHVRSAIRRKGQPDVLYWKNHTVPLDVRVPDIQKIANDWEEYDPREQEGCSAYGEMPA